MDAAPQGSAQHFQGRLTFIDNAVDLTTGTIKLKATFDNAAHVLWPGQFVDVALELSTQKNAVVIPTRASSDSPMIWTTAKSTDVNRRRTARP